jgi:hypothetical protein
MNRKGQELSHNETRGNTYHGGSDMTGITGKPAPDRDPGMPALQTTFADSACQVRNLVLFMRPQNPGVPLMAAWSKCSESFHAGLNQTFPGLVGPALLRFGEGAPQNRTKCGHQARSKGYRDN